MHVPPQVQPCPSCYAFCVTRPQGHPPGAPPVPRHAHHHPQQQQYPQQPCPQQHNHQQCQPHNPQCQQPHSPGGSPHRNQPRGCGGQPQPQDNRFGSLPHPSQPGPKVPPHYNSLPHHQAPAPPPPPHCAPHHGPPPPPHGIVPPGRPHVSQGPRHPQHMPPSESPAPRPPPHAAPPCQQQHRCPTPSLPHPQSPPYYGNLRHPHPHPHQHPNMPQNHPPHPQQQPPNMHPQNHPPHPHQQPPRPNLQQSPHYQHPHPHPHPPLQQQQPLPPPLPLDPPPLPPNNPPPLPQNPPPSLPPPQALAQQQQHPPRPMQQQQQPRPQQMQQQHPPRPQQMQQQQLPPRPQQPPQQPQQYIRPQQQPLQNSHHPPQQIRPQQQPRPPQPQIYAPGHPHPQQFPPNHSHGPNHPHPVNHHPHPNGVSPMGPPRPPPLPPPLPPPQPFDQLRYGCLSHQQLVPPPPLPPQPPSLCHPHHLHPHQLPPQQLYGCLSQGCHHHLLDFPPAGSPVKVDRGYGGKGPPGRGGLGSNITKSYSIEGSAPPVPPHHLHHAHHHHHHNGTHTIRRQQLQQTVSQSSGVGGRRAAPRGSTADDSSSRSSRWRGSGGQGGGQGYELSQDFTDMRLEMLERRYGGMVARRAAITIQRAYRRHAMYKKFRSITATAKAQEKRLSRRFTVDVPEWPSETGSGQQTCHDTEHLIRNEFDQLQRNLSATVYGEGRRPARSLSMRDTPRNTTALTTTSASNTLTRHHHQQQQQQEDTYDLHDTLAAMSDTSLYCHVPAQSPLTPTPTPTPAPTHVRNGSGDYQAHQNDRDLKYFSSEDSGLGSQESGRLVGSQQRKAARASSGGSNSGSAGSGKKVPPEVPRRTSSIKSNESGGSTESIGSLFTTLFGESFDDFMDLSTPTTVSGTSSHRLTCQPPSLTPPSSTPSSLTSDGCHSDRGPLTRSADNGSLSSVQSSGSDSSLSQSTSDRATPLSTLDQPDQSDYHPTSPVWKRKNQMITSEPMIPCDDKRLSQISENSEDSLQSHSSEGMTYSQTIPSQTPHSARYAHHAHYTHTSHMPKVPEVVRKRQYRVGLNLFNKKPERGVTYLIGRGFLENSPPAVAKFLLTRKGLSKQMIGEYLGNLQSTFNMAVLECFAGDIDLSGMQVDVALRKFQTHFRMPGEAQKIERLMQIFAQRYCQCNRDIVTKLRDPETIFILAFAIIMLNTDLHTASMKQEKRMKIEDFIKNLRGIDDGYDIEREMLEGMYHRIKSQEFRPGHDHVTQVLKVQQTMVGKTPNLALPHRRLVCYCRLYEIPDVAKKERVGVHQREVFLFNDLLVVTKIFSKKKNTVTYTFRQSFPLAGLAVSTKEVAHYPYLMEVRHRVDNKVLIIFNARNEHDRTKFCEDLKESVCEMDEMESLRIEGELERQKASLRASRPNSTAENRDSGVADMELMTTTSEKNGTLKADSTLKRSALSNSLLDIHEAVH